MGGDFDALIKSLAQAAGLSEEMASDILDTALEYVKEQRPDKAEQIDARLQDERIARRAGDLIGKLASKGRPEGYVPESDPAADAEVSS